MNPTTTHLCRQIEETGRTIAFASIHPQHCLGLEELVSRPIFITRQSPAWRDEVEGRGVEFIIPEARVNTTLDLLLTPEGRHFLRNREDISLIVFKNSHRLETLADHLDVQLLAPSSNAARRLENKLFLQEVLEDVGLVGTEGRQIVCGRLSYNQIRREVGDTFVLQFAHGFGGNSSHIITSDREYREVVDGKSRKKAKVSPWWDDSVTLTVNGCVLTRGVALAPTFRQLTGLPSLTSRPLAACGNDWDLSELPDGVEDEIYRAADKIGRFMRDMDFRGFFGLDFLWSRRDQTLRVVEINSRFTSSLSMFTQLQLERDETPLLLLHLAEFLGLEPEVPDLVTRSASPAAQMILHSKADHPFYLDHPPQAGIYRAVDLEYVRPGHMFADIEGTDEFLFLPAPQGTLVSPGGELGRIWWNRSVGREGLDPHCRMAAQWAREFTERVKVLI